MNWILLNITFMLVGLIVANAPVIWALVDSSRREREQKFHEDVKNYLHEHGIDKRELESRSYK